MAPSDQMTALKNVAQTPQDIQSMDITVAIPTYNGADRLPPLLDQLRSQTQTSNIRWEIIVCDNGSTDDTAAVVRRYQADWPGEVPLHYKFAAEQGAAFARQYAVESAQGQLIAFLDDDNIPESDWVFQAYEFAQSHPEAGAFGSQIHGKFETELPNELTNIRCFLAIIERGGDPEKYIPANKILPPAAGLVVRRQAWLNAVPKRLFLNNKGKEAGLASEDLEAILHIQKSGWDIWYNPNMVVHHDIPDGRLRKDYLVTLFRCVGLSRYHIRLLGLKSWQRPVAIPAYIANDIRKLAFHRLRHGAQQQLTTTEACDRELLKSTLTSPLFLLKKVYKDSRQASRDKKDTNRQQQLAQLTTAFEQNQFVLYQQPVISIGQGRIHATNQPSAGSIQNELLIRLQDHNQDNLLPSNFLPAAQRYGLMRALDRWVIRHVFDWLTRTAQSSNSILTAAEQPDLAQAVPLYSINLSEDSVLDPSLPGYIAKKFGKATFAPHLLCFEIDANTALKNPTQTTQLIESLNRLGCQVTIDNVTLQREDTALISQLPINYIKLAAATVNTLKQEDNAAWAQIRTLMANNTISTVAKGIESTRILQRIQQQGIDYGQGYQLGRPTPLA